MLHPLLLAPCLSSPALHKVLTFLAAAESVAATLVRILACTSLARTCSRKRASASPCQKRSNLSARSVAQDSFSVACGGLKRRKGMSRNAFQYVKTSLVDCACETPLSATPTASQKASSNLFGIWTKVVPRISLSLSNVSFAKNSQLAAACSSRAWHSSSHAMNYPEAAAGAGPGPFEQPAH